MYLYALGHALIKQTIYTNIKTSSSVSIYFLYPPPKKKNLKRGTKLPPCSSPINTPRSTKCVEGDVDTIVCFSENRHDRV